jgi:hypothetical protein
VPAPQPTSRSFGLGSADSNNGKSGSELLDEIELNELADIADDKGLLSPDRNR